MTPNSIFALFFRKTCVCFGKSVPQTHDILVFKPYTEPLDRQEYKKKYEQKNVLPARAEAIYIIRRILSAPRNTVGTTQRVRCHPGGDPSQHVRVLKATFHHRGTRHFFARALVVGVFVFFVVLMRVVGFQWV